MFSFKKSGIEVASSVDKRWWYKLFFFWSRHGDYFFIYHVALARRQRRDLSVFESNCHLPTGLPHMVEASHCPLQCCQLSAILSLDLSYLHCWFWDSVCRYLDLAIHSVDSGFRCLLRNQTWDSVEMGMG